MSAFFARLRAVIGDNKNKQRKILLAVAVLVFFVGIFATAHPALAGIDQLAEPSWWMRLFASILLQIASLFLKIALFFLTFIIELASYNGYLDATAVTVGWVMVRDITNMFFVVALLLIAFGTILGIEQYEWKKLLIKFVLAAVLVNFSRLICGVFIDISQIVMSTFVNGVVATAGGNVINMFNLDKITSIARDANPEHLDAGLFTATVASVVFAGMVMMTFGIFIFMLVARVIRLWILIVLSPLAFVLNVIPLTQKYAGQWWSEFGDDLVTGPVLLFFIWLSFVSLGSGDVSSHIAANADIPENQKIKEGQALTTGADQVGNNQSAGVGAAMTWTRMANFVIAVGMLFAGAKVASTIGGSSGSALSKVGEFGKKVATIASGYAAGRWLYERGQGGAKGALKGVGIGLAHVTPVASWYKRAKNYAVTQWEGAKATALAPQFRPKTERVYNEEKKRWEDQKIFDKKTGKPIMEEYKRGGLVGLWQRRAQARYKAEIASEKVLEKTKAFGENRKDLLKARVSGVPEYWLQGKGEKTDALDRMEKGMLEQEKERSAQKTAEFGTLGKELVAEFGRIKYGEGGKLQQIIPGAKQMDEVAGHTLRAEFAKGRMKQLEATVKLEVATQKGSKEAAAVAGAVEAGRVAHTKEAAFKEFQKEKEKEYLGTKAGIHEMEEEAGIKFRTEALEKEIKQAETEAEQKVAEHLKDVIGRTAAAELGEQAAKSFIDQIKQEKIGEIFSKSAKELAEAMKKLKAGGGTNLKEVLAGLQNVGARATFAEIQAAYFKDRVAGAAKNQATDEAESMWSFHRSGYETPATAFTKLSKKQQEALQGVEREKAVSMVSDMMKRLLLKEPDELGVDQQADYMAGLEYLVKNGWSDDLLARMVDLAQNSIDGDKYDPNSQQGKEAANIADLLVNKLGWAKNVNGQVVLENKSSEKRTNDLHRLMGFAGNADLLMAENAALLHQKSQALDGNSMGYSRSAEHLAEQVQAALARGATEGLSEAESLAQYVVTNQMKDVGAKLGWSMDRIVNQLKTFATSFVTTGNNAARGQEGATAQTIASEAKRMFVEEIKRYSGQAELLTQQKSAALATTHIDDAGHQKFNMDEGFAHGLLSDDAMDFMLSDWIKVDGAKKMRDLKIHGIADMSENADRTASNFDATRVAATFKGIDTKQKIELLDVRNQRQIVKLGSNEAGRLDPTTKAFLLDMDSKIATKFAHIQDPFQREQAVKQDIARDFAVMLKQAPQVLLTLLGKESGVGYNNAMKGGINVKIFDQTFVDKDGGSPEEGIKKLITWVNDNLELDSRHLSQTDSRRIEDLRVEVDEVISKLPELDLSDEDETATTP